MQTLLDMKTWGCLLFETCMINTLISIFHEFTYGVSVTHLSKWNFMCNTLHLQTDVFILAGEISDFHFMKWETKLLFLFLKKLWVYISTGVY